MKRQKPRSTDEKFTAWSSNRISRFSQSFLREWKRLDLPGVNSTVVVAVSGGADSVAMLLALDELVRSNKLRLKVLVAHLNHGLRAKVSDADAHWVASLAKRLGYRVTVGSADVNRRSAQSGDNLEQAARRARYEFLERKARDCQAGVILTAHTMDDQAETVLLHLLRGSGAHGLAGVDPVRPFSPDHNILLARPLLSWARRRHTEKYCRSRGVEFRSDAMNEDERFTRVRVRRQLLPLMETFNPKLVEGLARTAALLRDDSVALDRGATTLLELSIIETDLDRRGKVTTAVLRVDLLSAALPALRRGALRLWMGQCRGDLRRLERVHILALENLLLGDKGGRVVELPGGGRVSRRRGCLEYRSSAKSLSADPELRVRSGRNNPRPRR